MAHNNNGGWKTVGPRKTVTKEDRAREQLTRDLVDDIRTEGFRTFEKLVPLYSVVLLNKLQSRYFDVKFTVKVSQNGTTSHTGDLFHFVLITMTGPRASVDAAYADAAPFLLAERADPNRLIQDTWTGDALPAQQLHRAIQNAASCASRLHYNVNYSHATSRFFMATVLLERESLETTPAAVKRRMRDEVIAHLTAKESQVFRLEEPAQPAEHVAPTPASRGGMAASRGGRGGQGYSGRSAGSIQAQVNRELQEIDSMDPEVAKKRLREVVLQYSDVGREDLLSFLYICYGVEKVYARAMSASNEMRALDIKRASTMEKMVEVSFPPESGHRPFTQRWPKIDLDETVVLRLTTSSEVEMCKVYMVQDWKLILHYEEDNGMVANAAQRETKVDLTFDPAAMVGYLTHLQNATNSCDGYDRIRGIKEKKVDHTKVQKANEAHEKYRKQHADATDDDDDDDDDDDRSSEEADAAPARVTARGRGSFGPIGRGQTRGRQNSSTTDDEEEEEEEDETSSSGGDVVRGPRAARGGYASRGRGAYVPQLAAPTADTQYNGLTRVQIDACKAIVNSDHPRIFIDGPGGTGKTEVLARSLVSLILRKKRVIVAAATNAAADIVAGRLLKLLHEHEADSPQSLSRRVLRYYRETISPLNVDPLLYEYSNGSWSYTDPGEKDEKTGRVKAGTRVKGQRKEFHELRYHDRFHGEIEEADLVDINVIITSGSSAVRGVHESFRSSISHFFIDEVGSVALCDAIRSVSSIATRATIVLSGDPNQLQPRAICPANKPYLSVCPISPQFLGNVLRYQLRDSYRSNADLTRLQSQLFYDGSLKVAVRAESFDDGAYSKWSGHRGSPSAFRIIHCAGQEETYVDSHKALAESIRLAGGQTRAGTGGGVLAETADKVNMSEVDTIENLVRSLVSEMHVKPKDIAVLCEYDSQKRRIRQRMAMLGFKTILVNGIEEFQGGERDIVIVSLVRSQVDNSDPFFLNVAKLCTTLTRARQLMLFVGNVPVFLEHDRVHHAKRNSTGKWTEFVHTCIERNCVDLYDEDTETFSVPPKLDLTHSRVEIKEFVPKSVRDQMIAQRMTVTRQDINAEPSAYFIGIVTGIADGRVLVRNRFKCVHEALLDDDVSSGVRRYALFPGDVVALRLAPEVARWVPYHGNVYADRPHPTADFHASADSTTFFDYYCYDAYPDAFEVTRQDVRPVGTLACLLQIAEDYPRSIVGIVQGGDFCPLTDKFPRLPLHAAHRHERFNATETRAAYVDVVDGLRFYRLVPASVDAPMPRLIAAGQFTPAQFQAMSAGVPEMIPSEWFQFFEQQRGLRAPLIRLGTVTKTPGASLSEVDITVCAPALGLWLACDPNVNAKCNALGWSDDAMAQFGRRKEYPLVLSEGHLHSGGFELPTPPDNRLLMIGVKFRVRYSGGGLYGAESSGAEVLQPQVVLFLRPAVKFGVCNPQQELLMRDVVRRHGEGNFSSRQMVWQHHLLHLANHAAARCLLNWKPQCALLLRQTAMVSEIPVDDGTFESLDSPEWFVPSSANNGRCVYLGRHTHAGFSAYTSFISPHHSYGDMVVQRLLLAASGSKVASDQLTPVNLKRLANRLNAIVLQGR